MKFFRIVLLTLVCNVQVFCVGKFGKSRKESLISTGGLDRSLGESGFRCDDIDSIAVCLDSDSNSLQDCKSRSIPIPVSKSVRFGEPELLGVSPATYSNGVSDESDSDEEKSSSESDFFSKESTPGQFGDTLSYQFFTDTQPIYLWGNTVVCYNLNLVINKIKARRFLGNLEEDLKSCSPFKADYLEKIAFFSKALCFLSKESKLNQKEAIINALSTGKCIRSVAVKIFFEDSVFDVGEVNAVEVLELVWDLVQVVKDFFPDSIKVASKEFRHLPDWFKKAFLQAFKEFSHPGVKVCFLES